MDYRPLHVHGGVIIQGAAGGGRLLDFYRGLDDTSLDLTSQAITDEADVYINLMTKCKYFFCEEIIIGYVDTAAIDDFAALYLLEGPHATDLLQSAKVRWSDTNGIAESTLPVSTAVNKGFNLDTAGRLYFLTNWTTQVINCSGATEYFLIIVNGYTTHRVP